MRARKPEVGQSLEPSSAHGVGVVPLLILPVKQEPQPTLQKNLTFGYQFGIMVYVRVREGSKIMYLFLHISLQLPASKGLPVIHLV